MVHGVEKQSVPNGECSNITSTSAYKLLEAEDRHFNIQSGKISSVDLYSNNSTHILMTVSALTKS